MAHISQKLHNESLSKACSILLMCRLPNMFFLDGEKHKTGRGDMNAQINMEKVQKIAKTVRSIELLVEFEKR